MAFGVNGIACYAFMKNDSLGYDPRWFVAVMKSTNSGASWTGEYTFPKNQCGYSPDKPHMTLDKNPSSPFKNYVYIAWTDLVKSFFLCKTCSEVTLPVRMI